jgi:hypothetical protein
MPGRSRVTAHKMGEPRAVRHRACTGEHHRAMPGRSRVTAQARRGPSLAEAPTRRVGLRPTLPLRRRVK